MVLNAIMVVSFCNVYPDKFQRSINKNIPDQLVKHVVCIEPFEGKAPFTNAKTIDWLNATNMTGFIHAICH